METERRLTTDSDLHYDQEQVKKVVTRKHFADRLTPDLMADMDEMRRKAVEPRLDEHWKNYKKVRNCFRAEIAAHKVIGGELVWIFVAKVCIFVACMLTWLNQTYMAYQFFYKLNSRFYIKERNYET